MNTIRISYEGTIATVVFDVPGERMNVFNRALMADLGTALDELQKRTDFDTVLFRSAKPGCFIAGADIKLLRSAAGRREAHKDVLEMAHTGQRLFDRVEAMQQKTVAVIDGACLGGGMEFALACDIRIASDGDKTVLGLPEVQLGILPGWGGTQRLPRLVGLAPALEMILAGKRLDARKALKAGLVDRIAAPPFLDAAIRDLLAHPPKRTDPRPRWWYLAFFWPRMMASIAAGQAKAKTHGLMPAPVRAAQVMGATAWGGPHAGLETEAIALADLAVTPQAANLIDAYFASEAAKKEGGSDGATVHVAGVLGAGVMGGGIAWAFAHAGVMVRVKDLTWEALAKAHATAADYNKKLVKIRKLTPGAAIVEGHRISGTVDFSGFHAADVVVEAVVENLEVKRKVLAELENHVRDDTVIASNTSSLSIADMATAMKRPQRFVGMHFFNPVNRMPLVEVVAGPASDPKAVATIANLSRRCGKTAIVVRDCPGFLVNRCLLPYLDEAGRCLEDGASVEQIDRVLLHFGMPMGPFALCDEIGLDVGYKVAKILGTAYGERMAVPEVLRRVYEELHLTGAKGGKGFYLGKAKDGKVNPQIANILPASKGRAPSDSEILDRCLLMWINEASRCLAEGVVASGELCDLAMLMGTGFPPSRGGPIHEANTRGVSAVVERLRALAERHGPRFAPSELLVSHARDRKPLPISSVSESKGG